MHTIDLSKYSVHTDLIIENKDQKNYDTYKESIDNIVIERTTDKAKKEKENAEEVATKEEVSTK